MKTKRILLAILLLSVILRVGVALYLGNVVDAPSLLTDQRSYHALGERLITGHGFSFDVGWYPFTPPETPTAHWSFLYSLFVAAVYGIFGVHPLAVRLLQGVVGGILLPWMVYRIALLLTRGETQPGMARSPRGGWQAIGPASEVFALLAALLTAVYAYFVLYAATLMTETFYIVALLWSLEEAVRLRRDPSRANGARLGLVLGVCTLLRQSILPWLVVLFVWLLWKASARRVVSTMVSGLVVTVAVMALLILPFTIRNYRAYHSFLLLNSNAGYAMFSAQHPMHGTTFQPFAAAPVPAELSGLNEAQLDRELMRRGIGFVLAEPMRYVRLSISRVGAFFEFWPSGTTTLLHNIGRTVSFGAFLPFMFYGAWLALRYGAVNWAAAGRVRLDREVLGLVLLFMVFYSALHILTWAMPRYRLAVDALALPLAAFGLVDLLNRLLVSRRPVTSALPE